jgi:hypothetical protein
VELKELMRLVKFCRGAGVMSYKSGDTEFTLSPNDPKEDRRSLKKLRTVEKTVEQKLAEMSEEDLLLYSSQGFSEKDA